MRVILYIRTSAAYDFDMKRTPEHDDWETDDLGQVPDGMELLKTTAKARHPKALEIRAVIEPRT